MHIIVGKISAIYSGRGDSTLPEYERIVILKNDGTIAIHSDKGLKPLNYMSGPTTVDEIHINGNKIWKIATRKETLEITFHEIYDEIKLSIGTNEPGIHMDRTEHQLQEWLTTNIQKIEPTIQYITREYETGDGPVDLYCRNIESNEYIALEVKRVAPMGTVGQVLRYLTALQENEPEKQHTAMIAAVEFKQKTLELAEKRGVKCLKIPENWHQTYQEHGKINQEVEEKPVVRKEELKYLGLF